MRAIDKLTAAPRLSAVVLAAGRSARMGRDKALLAVDGMPLWRRQRDVLVQAGATEIFLSARDDQVWQTEAAIGECFHAVVPDSVAGCGPLAGIVAALERATHPHLAVLAIDLPRMEPSWFRSLARECAPGCGVVGIRVPSTVVCPPQSAVPPRGAAFEPLASILPREILRLARPALERRELSLQQLMGAAIDQGFLRSREIMAAELTMFENWNRAKDVGLADGGR